MKNRMDPLFRDNHFGYGMHIENLNYEAEDLIWKLIDKTDTVPDDKQSEYIQAILNSYEILLTASNS